MLEFLRIYLGPLGELIKIVVDILKEQYAIITGVGAAAGVLYKLWHWISRKPTKDTTAPAKQSAKPDETLSTKKDIVRDDLVVRPVDSIDELRTVYSFDENAYADMNQQHVDNIPFQTFQEWWDAWPEGFYAAFEDDKPVCVIGVFPITREWAEGLLKRKYDERALQREDIEKADRTIWYISGISAKDPGGDGLHSGVPVLLTHTLVRWYLKNSDVLNRAPVQVISVAVSKMGRKLLEKVGFMPAVNAKNKDEHPIYAREVSRDRMLRFLNDHPMLSRYFTGEIKADFEEALKKAPQLQSQTAAFKANEFTA